MLTALVVMRRGECSTRCHARALARGFRTARSETLARDEAQELRAGSRRLMGPQRAAPTKPSTLTKRSLRAVRTPTGAVASFLLVVGCRVDPVDSARCEVPDTEPGQGRLPALRCRPAGVPPGRIRSTEVDAGRRAPRRSH